MVLGIIDITIISSNVPHKLDNVKCFIVECFYGFVLKNC